MMKKKGNLLIGGIAGILAIILIMFYAQSESTHQYFEGLANLIAKYPIEALIPAVFMLLFVVCVFVIAVQVTATNTKINATKTPAAKKKIEQVQKKACTASSKPITKKPDSKPISSSIKSVI